jgi:hypothetical protein
MTNKKTNQPKSPGIPEKPGEPPFTEPKEPVIQPAEVSVRNPGDNPSPLPETPPLPCFF